jgi:hypothetical protein
MPRAALRPLPLSQIGYFRLNPNFRPSNLAPISFVPSGSFSRSPLPQPALERQTADFRPYARFEGRKISGCTPKGARRRGGLKGGSARFERRKMSKAARREPVMREVSGAEVRGLSGERGLAQWPGARFERRKREVLAGKGGIEALTRSKVSAAKGERAARFERRKGRGPLGLSGGRGVGRRQPLCRMRGLSGERVPKRGLNGERLLKKHEANVLSFAPPSLLFHKYRGERWFPQTPSPSGGLRPPAAPRASPSPLRVSPQDINSPSGGFAPLRPPQPPPKKAGTPRTPGRPAAPRPPGGLRPPALRAAPSACPDGRK